MKEIGNIISANVLNALDNTSVKKNKIIDGEIRHKINLFFLQRKINTNMDG